MLGRKEDAAGHARDCTVSLPAESGFGRLDSDLFGLVLFHCCV